MTASELGQEIANVLQTLDTDSYASVLLGAGASVGAGLPDWTRFLVKCLLESGAINDESLAEAFVRKQNLMLVAEAAKAAAPGCDSAGLLICETDCPAMISLTGAFPGRCDRDDWRSRTGEYSL